MNKILFLFVFSANCLLTTFIFAQASPLSVKIKQKNGTSLTIIGKGNINISYTETVDGYSLVPNKNTIYEYAVADSSGDLVPSGILAHDKGHRKLKERTFLKKQPVHLRYTGKKLNELLEKLNDPKQPIQ